METTYNVTDQNTNDLQFGGSCTAHAIGNASELSYYSSLGKIKINMNLFWQWREDEKYIPSTKGGFFSNTYNLLKEFDNYFGGLPMEFVGGRNDGERGLVKVPRMYEWGGIRDDFQQIQKCIKEIQRKGGLGVIFSISTNKETFSECNINGDGFIRFTGGYDGGHAMCFEGYSKLGWRNVTIKGVTKRIYAPEYFIVGNSWGQRWGKEAKGITKLKVEDFYNVYNYLATMIDWERDDEENPIRYEDEFSALEDERKENAIRKAEVLQNSDFRDEFLEFYS